MDALLGGSGVVAGTAAIAYAFSVQQLPRGVGPYHVNQFRIYFTVNEATSAVALAKRLRTNFAAAFTHERNRIATAELFSLKDSRGNDAELVHFRCRVLAAAYTNSLLRLIGATEFIDNVLLTRYGKKRAQIREHEPYASFSARTLGDAAEYSEQVPQGVLRVNRRNRHFLTGVRSWCIGPVGQTGGSSGSSVFFLETSALERFSARLYLYTPGVRKQITQCWRDFLCAAVQELGTAVEPTDWDRWSKCGCSPRLAEERVDFDRQHYYSNAALGT